MAARALVALLAVDVASACWTLDLGHNLNPGSAHATCPGVPNGEVCAPDGSSNYHFWDGAYHNGIFRGVFQTNQCSNDKWGYCPLCDPPQYLVYANHSANCVNQTVPAPQYDPKDGPHGAQLRGRVGMTLAGVNIYGPEEAGFGFGPNPMPCTDGTGYCYAGVDVPTCESALDIMCSATGSKVVHELMLDSCGGHAPLTTTRRTGIYPIYTPESPEGYCYDADCPCFEKSNDRYGRNSNLTVAECACYNVCDEVSNTDCGSVSCDAMLASGDFHCADDFCPTCPKKNCARAVRVAPRHDRGLPRDGAAPRRDCNGAITALRRDTTAPRRDTTTPRRDGAPRHGGLRRRGRLAGRARGARVLRREQLLPDAVAEDLFVDAETGAVDYGILAVENSLRGSINKAFDLLLQHDLRIYGEIVVTEGPLDYTRFLVLSTTDAGPPLARPKTSLAFAVIDRPGALAEALGEFGRRQGSKRERNSQLQRLISRPFSTRGRGINLLKLESRPRRRTTGAGFTYVFFLGFEGTLRDEPCVAAVKALLERCAFVRFLGSDDAAPPVEREGSGNVADPALLQI
ncbi:arogenate dehydratase [Aureococcus anophagefferens]|nr:arogenate dehydratase [Aureococcus anophagefferens]